MASLRETQASHADLDALAAALAERLHLANGSPWMNTAETAEYLRVSVRWLRQHLHQVPHSKVEGPAVLQPYRAGRLAGREAPKLVGASLPFRSSAARSEARVARTW